MALAKRQGMLWFCGIILAILLLAGVALQIAIWVNGSWVLERVDRIAGDSADVAQMVPVQYGDDPQQRLIISRPKGIATDARLPVILFIHGGSWSSGKPENYAFIGRSFAPHGFVVVSAGYRLGDAGKYPAMLQDGATAIVWTRANIAELGGNPDAIYLMGHSAGAYNAVMLALDQQWMQAAGVPASTIRGVIGISGPYDFLPLDTPDSIRTFGDAPDLPATQPINFVRDDAPPMLLVSGDADTKVKPRNTRALAAALEGVGVEVQTAYHPGMDHSDPLVALAAPWRKSSQVHDEILRFLSTACTSSVPVQGETR